MALGCIKGLMIIPFTRPVPFQIIVQSFSMGTPLLGVVTRNSYHTMSEVDRQKQQPIGGPSLLYKELSLPLASLFALP